MNEEINVKKQLRISLQIAFESLIKIIVAIILAYTPLGIVGVWIAYLCYAIVQEYLSKNRYYEFFEEFKNQENAT